MAWSCASAHMLASESSGDASIMGTQEPQEFSNLEKRPLWVEQSYNYRTHTKFVPKFGENLGDIPICKCAAD